MILVTGAAGFIGHHLVIRLLQNGEKVIGLDSLNSYYDLSLKIARLRFQGIDHIIPGIENISEVNPGYSFYLCDLSDQDALTRIIVNRNFKAVIHLAAQAGVRFSIENPHAYTTANLVGFANLLELLRKNSPESRLIFASSSSVYGDSQAIPFTESEKLGNPLSYYAATKQANESMAASYANIYSMDIIGLRFFTVYGELGRPDMAYFSFSSRILEGKPIDLYNFGKMKRDFTEVTDVVLGIESALNLEPFIPKRFSVYNLGNDNPIQLEHFVDLLEKNLGLKAIRNYLPMQPGDVDSTWANLAKSRAELGFSPGINIEHGIEKFCRWFLEFNSE